MIRWLTLCLTALLLVACNNKSATDAPAPVAPMTSAKAAAPAPAAVAAADDDLATEEDFADDAEKTIDEKNYDAELDKLDKEITE